MKRLTGGALLLIVLAASAWGVALLDRAGSSTAGNDGVRSPVQPLPYPGADRLVARRVVADVLFCCPSPDGTRLAHQGHSGDLVLLDLRTGERRFLTGDPTVWDRPRGTTPTAFRCRFSPDGRHIAYEWRYDGPATIIHAIRVLDLATGQEREIFRGPTGHAALVGSWSPDGQSIAVTLSPHDNARPSRIVLVRVRDRAEETIASYESDVRGRGAIFSPDGRWLAYNRPRRDGRGDDHDIFLLSVDGIVEIPLTRGPGHHRVAGWLPGGGPLFYLRDERNRSDLMAVEVDDGRAVSEPRLVRSGFRRVGAVGFSGSAFFYYQTPELRQLHTARIDPEDGRLTSPFVPLFPATAAPRAGIMAWSPDGSRMAYLEGNDLVVRSLSTGAERRIRTAFASPGTLEWSPGPDRLAIQSTDQSTGIDGIYIVDLADGSTELVRSRAGTVVAPRWSADGKSLFVARPDSEGGIAADIMRLDLESGEERVVFRAEAERGPAFTGFAVHPGGRHLAVGLRGPPGGGPDRVILVPVDGAEPRELVRVEAPEGISYQHYGLEWTPDGRYLIIAGNPDPEQRRTLWIVDGDGTELRVLASISSGPMAMVHHQVRPRMLPGGREITVFAGRDRQEIWALEGFRSMSTPPDSMERPGGDGSVP
jgi:Tol biopolymer transport system component